VYRLVAPGMLVNALVLAGNVPGDSCRPTALLACPKRHRPGNLRVRILKDRTEVRGVTTRARQSEPAGPELASIQTRTVNLMKALETNAVAAEESYSQWGEDRLVWEFFGGQTGGFFLEAGAFHPVHLSQTYLLEKRGWQGVLVEPLPDNRALFAEKRPRSILVPKALGAPEQAGQELTFLVPGGETSLARLVGSAEQPAAGERVLRVPLTTMSAVLAEAKLPRLDYLSLDLEGHELAALRGLDFDRWRPVLIVIEDRVQDLALHGFLKQRGYRLVYRTGCNNWYVAGDRKFPRCTPWVRLQLCRKMFLALPFRKLRGWRR